MKRKGKKKKQRGEHVIILYIEYDIFPYDSNFVSKVDTTL